MHLQRCCIIICEILYFRLSSHDCKLAVVLVSVGEGEGDDIVAGKGDEARSPVGCANDVQVEYVTAIGCGNANDDTPYVFAKCRPKDILINRSTDRRILWGSVFR